MCTVTNVDKDPVDQWIGEDKHPDDREAESEADKDREADKELTVAEDKEPADSDFISLLRIFCLHDERVMIT